MRIGIFAGDVAARGGAEEVLADARQAAEDGFPSFWLPQIFGLDAITMAGVIAREVPDIEIGTAVVPTYPRHPLMLAQQALTASALAGGRFTLGIGLSHQVVIETVMGLSFAKPLQHMREYLSILRPLVHERTVAFEGETLRTTATIDPGAAEPCPILVAALGPKMLEIAGGMADGTITWMTGPETIAGHVVPTLTSSAERRGRPTPRVVAGVPVCVTDDELSARDSAARALRRYGTLPSYRAMLTREGLDSPVDIALIGDEDSVRAGLARFADAGVQDLLAVELSHDARDRRRTRSLLRSLV